jgi:hypothetical protein
MGVEIQRAIIRSTPSERLSRLSRVTTPVTCSHPHRAILATISNGRSTPTYQRAISRFTFLCDKRIFGRNVTP